MSWDGDDYQRRFDQLAAGGMDVHGEADLVGGLVGLVTPAGPGPAGAGLPVTVLDAGCGTGRVAIELARRGLEVVGVDVDPSMIATARRLAPELDWVQADLAELELGRTFDVVVMAGNVLLFTEPGTQPQVVARVAEHLAPGSVLVAGFQLGRGYEVDDHDRAAAAAGLEQVDRWSTWDRRPFPGDGTYAVSVHRRP